MRFRTKTAYCNYRRLTRRQGKRARKAKKGKRFDEKMVKISGDVDFCRGALLDALPNRFASLVTPEQERAFEIADLLEALGVAVGAIVCWLGMTKKKRSRRRSRRRNERRDRVGRGGTQTQIRRSDRVRRRTLPRRATLGVRFQSGNENEERDRRRRKRRLEGISRF